MVNPLNPSAGSELVRNDWFYAKGYHTGHYPLECLRLTPTEDQRKAAEARDPSIELELALAALNDGWLRSEGRRNYLLTVVHTRLELRCPTAARAFWDARDALKGKRFDLRTFPSVFQTLARLKLAWILTLGML